MKKSTVVSFLVVLIAITGYNIANAQRIMVTYAGTGVGGFSGDWGAGKAAQINQPHDVCMDAANNIYLIDQTNGRIRKISAQNGVISTFAGGGTSTVDGVPAISALLTPNYMCIDASSSNIYLTSSNQIKKINIATGIITTVAGLSTAGFSGDGGPAIAASMQGPAGICIDASGNLYVADESNNRIREIYAATGIINTIGGSGVYSYSGDGGPALLATLSDPMAIGVDASGNVFFSDQDGNYIREIVASTGMMKHIAGIPVGYVAAAAGGPAATTAIGQIYGMHIDARGDLYCDDGSCSCVHIDMRSGNIYLEAGSLASDGYNGDDRNAINDFLNVPGGLWVDGAGNIFIADQNNNRMRKAIQLTHTPTFAFGKAQYINACPSGYIAIDSQLTITDLDSAQPETWTVISAPMHGVMAGFPFTTLSLGTNSVVTPTSVYYVPSSSYEGLDSFQVQVSDGALTDIVTVYVAVGAGNITGPTRVCAAASVLLTDDILGGVWSESNTNATLATDGTVTGVLAGTDVIEYAINTTCGMATSSSTVTVDLLAPTTAGTIAGPESLCAGVAASLTNATEDGVWSVRTPGATISSAGVLTGATAGTVTVMYTVTNGCGTIATSDDITILPQPDAGTITTSETTICTGSTITLSDGAAGGVWSAANNHSAITSAGVLTGVTPGTDNILYSVTNSCGTATASQAVIIIRCTTGVSSVSSTPGITIFPNPAAYSLNISWSDLLPGNASVVVIDVTSREVLRTALFDNANGTGETQLNISDLKEGVYFLTFNSESAHFTNKFVVSK